MKIEPGLPTAPGYYACYFIGEKIALAVRYWDGQFWNANMAESVSTRLLVVSGTVGPLPVRDAAPAMEFDL